MKHVASGDFICPYVTFGNNVTDILKDSLKKITISPATRNLPIDNDLYLSTLKKFILSNGFNKEVVPSPHMIRWY